MLFFTSDSSSSNVSTVSLGVSSELEFNHSWNRYENRNNQNRKLYQRQNKRKTTTTKTTEGGNKKETNKQMGDGKAKNDIFYPLKQNHAQRVFSEPLCRTGNFELKNF